MSMEHIFRNLTDIRVFDIMIDMEEDNLLDTHEILDLLDYPDRENIQIQDSIDHLAWSEARPLKGAVLYHKNRDHRGDNLVDFLRKYIYQVV